MLVYRDRDRFKFGNARWADYQMLMLQISCVDTCEAILDLKP